MTQTPESLKEVAAITVEASISKNDLLRLRARAVRSGVWFRALRRIDRVLVNLTLRVSRRIQSPILCSALMSIANRLGETLRNRIEIATERYGAKLAMRVSLIAQRFGNKSSRYWATDLSFARFLAIMHINHQEICRP